MAAFQLSYLPPPLSDDLTPRKTTHDEPQGQLPRTVVVKLIHHQRMRRDPSRPLPTTFKCLRKINSIWQATAAPAAKASGVKNRLRQPGRFSVRTCAPGAAERVYV